MMCRSEVDDISFDIPSCAIDVRTALQRLRSELCSRPVSAEDIGSVEVVLGEVLNNIVEHAYGQGRQGRIYLSCILKRHVLRFRVEDMGCAMPRSRLPAGKLPALDKPLESLPEGGFGWFLVQNLAFDLSYRRENGRNILSFSIPFEATETGGFAQ